MDRQRYWGESSVKFDSGAYQSSTPYVKPLYTFSIALANIPRSKQSSLSAFYDEMRGRVTPFLIQDPYDFNAATGIVVTTGTAPTSFFLKTPTGFPVFAKSGSVVITSNLSGALTQNSHWVLDGTTGIIVASMRPTSADFWTVTSGEFYKKVAFTEYAENSPIWNIFNGSVTIQEIALP